MKSLVALLPCCLLTAALPAQEQPVGEILAAARVELRQEQDGTYSGAGWNRLLADGRQAQFFMAGEVHGAADIVHFETALHAALAGLGYSHSGLEVGPFSTRFAEEMIRSGPGRLEEYVRKPGNSFAFPFLGMTGEAKMAEQMVALSPDRSSALWGLDQEFVGSGPIAVDLLRRHARSSAQKVAVDALAARVAADRLFVARLSPADLAPVSAAFARNKEAGALIEALRTSEEIYRPFVRQSQPTYFGNLAREDYMKSNFVRKFAEAEARTGKPPKVFLKFGGYHAMRGISGTNVPSLTNFIAEWGHARGFRLANIMIDCNGGQAFNPQASKTVPCEGYFGKDSPLLAAAGADRLALFDLRPLRAQLPRLQALDERTRKLILAFDYYLAIRDVKPAVAVAAAPAQE